VPGWVRAAGEVAGYTVEVELAFDGGPYVCREVRVRQCPGGPSVTGEAIRAVPIGRLTAEVVSKAVFASAPGAAASALLLRDDEERKLRIRVEGPTDANLEQVAAVYRFGMLIGAGPTQTVADVFGLPRSTAGRWVALARDRVGLEPVETVRAGG
jgi:hypothetical protein